MFVVTMKWNKKTAVLIVAFAALLLCALILLCRGGSEPAGGASYDSPEARGELLASLGWEIDAQPVGEKSIVIPMEFSAVYEEYNRLQKAQGFDLSKHCGKRATVYTYAVHNYEGYVGSVVADIYVCDGELIGGDVHSLALDGFMHGLKKP